MAPPPELRTCLVALGLALTMGGCSPLLYVIMGGRDGDGGTTELVVGRTVQGSTDDEGSHVNLSCGSPEEAGDEAWTFVPPAAGAYRFTVDGDYDCAVGLFGPDDAARELACNDDAGSNNHSQVAADLLASRRYVVVVDGYRGNEGSYRLSVEAVGPPGTVPSSGGPPGGHGPTLPTVVPEDPAVMAPRCAAAPTLPIGSTTGSLDPTVATARTTCGSGPGGDVVYRLVVERSAHVTVKLEAAFDGILELRGACSPGPVLGCNDDSGDAVHSQITAQLAAGTYFVVVDSYDPRSSGSFTLQVLVLQ